MRTSSTAGMTASIDEMIDDFELLDDWEDRYRYVIELGRELEPLPEDVRTPENKVKGCVSQVWLSTRVRAGGNGEPVLSFRGDSDAHIVRGLIAILFAMYSDKSPSSILETDPESVFDRIGLTEHLTPQRSNGLFSMVARIRADAREALRVPAGQ